MRWAAASAASAHHGHRGTSARTKVHLCYVTVAGYGKNKTSTRARDVDGGMWGRGPRRAARFERRQTGEQIQIKRGAAASIPTGGRGTRVGHRHIPALFRPRGANKLVGGGFRQARGCTMTGALTLSGDPRTTTCRHQARTSSADPGRQRQGCRQGGDHGELYLRVPCDRRLCLSVGDRVMVKDSPPSRRTLYVVSASTCRGPRTPILGGAGSCSSGSSRARPRRFRLVMHGQRGGTLENNGWDLRPVLRGRTDRRPGGPLQKRQHHQRSLLRQRYRGQCRQSP